MSEKLKKHIHEIEHLEYSSREPMHASLFENKAMLSKITWDIHSYNAKKYYKQKNSDHSSTLEKFGYLTGILPQKEKVLLKEIYASCKKTTLDPFDFSSDYVYEPRKNLHEQMIRINNYYEPSEFFFKNFQTILDPLKEKLEKENQYYWRVASCRIFEVKPVGKTQDLHTDGQSAGIKKLFFYPNGANRKIGSTRIKDKLNNEIVIDLEPGSWLLFSNNECEHQAYSSENGSVRQTIEIDIMPDFISDTTLNYSGINSWYPWFPISESDHKISGNLDYDEVYDRNIKRLAGLCYLNKTDNYKFPCELSDFYDESSKIFEKKEIIEEKDESNVEITNNDSAKNVESYDMKTDIKDLADRNGLIIFLYNFMKIIPLLIIKKIIKRFK